MITTSLQYRVTGEKLQRFVDTLKVLDEDEDGSVLSGLRRNAIRSQIRELELEMQEYDALRAGAIREFQVGTLSDLPVALIKARIARNIKQSELAELIGVKAQQVQRWEKERYRTVSISRLSQIASALGVRIADRILLDERAPVTISEVKKAMTRLGLPREVFLQRLMPRPRGENDEPHLVDELDARLELIFGLGVRTAITHQELPNSGMRFKLPKSAAQDRTRAYARYVEGIATILARHMKNPSVPISENWSEAARQVFPAGRITLAAAVQACFARGICILPVREAVAFHGACLRVEGRTVITLKQTSREASRWLIDLLHEMYHDAVAPAGDFALIEEDETSAQRRDSLEERRATRFAAEVVTNGRYEQITSQVVREAEGQGPRLKAAVMKVAASAGVPVGILANLTAARLADDGFNWWGVAAGLQDDVEDPFDTVRRVLLANIDVSSMPRLEREIIMQALEDVYGS